MSLSLAPAEIVVPPRQRQPEIDDLFVESVRRQLINPIVLRQTEEGPTLVAGARRLLALKKLEVPALEENTHFRFIHNLSPDDAEILELEENVKRMEMPWRDHVKAVTRIHDLLSKRSDWSKDRTAAELSISVRFLDMNLMLAKRLDSNLLADARDMKHAYSILQVAADRAASEVVNQIIQTGAAVFDAKPAAIPNGAAALPSPTASASPQNGTTETRYTIEPAPNPTPAPAPPPPLPTPSPPPELVVNISFQDWLATYNGPKFNLIHCDFPYNVEYKSYAYSAGATPDDYDHTPFDALLTVFTDNLDKFCSYQAHIMFWFSMEYYEQIRQRLESAGLNVQRHPLIWLKSDNSGIIPGRDNQYTRRVYETAFLCSRGDRPLIKSLANAYPAPTASNSIHPSQKSEPMLKHFMSMLIDETTDVFDPTCGSGAALRVADSLGARSVLGLEIDANYAARAQAQTVMARNLRKAI